MTIRAATLFWQDEACEPARVICLGQAIPPIDLHQFFIDRLAEYKAVFFAHLYRDSAPFGIPA